MMVIGAHGFCNENVSLWLIKDRRRDCAIARKVKCPMTTWLGSAISAKSACEVDKGSVEL